MIPNYFSKFLLLSLFSVLIYACESHEKKADAYVRSKYSIKVSKGEKKVIKEKITPIYNLNKKSIKRIVPNEWQQFKIDMEKKIRKSFIDTGFGFPVHLVNVPMVKMRGSEN